MRSCTRLQPITPFDEQDEVRLLLPDLPVPVPGAAGPAAGLRVPGECQGRLLLPARGQPDQSQQGYVRGEAWE